MMGEVYIKVTIKTPVRHSPQEITGNSSIVRKRFTELVGLFKSPKIELCVYSIWLKKLTDSGDMSLLVFNFHFLIPDDIFVLYNDVLDKFQFLYSNQIQFYKVGYQENQFYFADHILVTVKHNKAEDLIDCVPLSKLENEYLFASQTECNFPLHFTEMRFCKRTKLEANEFTESDLTTRDRSGGSRAAWIYIPQAGIYAHGQEYLKRGSQVFVCKEKYNSGTGTEAVDDVMKHKCYQTQTDGREMGIQNTKLKERKIKQISSLSAGTNRNSVRGWGADEWSLIVTAILFIVIVLIIVVACFVKRFRERS